MSKEQELLPCPSCGSTDVLVIFGDDEAYSADCGDCCITGPANRNPDAAIKDWNALPRHLMWTSEPPKEPGHYWCRYIGTDKATWSPAYIPAVADLHFYNMDKHDQIEWAGPIPMPKEATL